MDFYDIDKDQPGSGQFLYLDTSKSSVIGSIARVGSPISLPASNGICYVRFWYKMIGITGLGSLQLYTNTKGRKGSQTVLSLNLVTWLSGRNFSGHMTGKAGHWVIKYYFKP